VESHPNAKNAFGWGTRTRRPLGSVRFENAHPLRKAQRVGIGVSDDRGSSPYIHCRAQVLEGCAPKGAGTNVVKPDCDMIDG
jgi:hypothetical protein